MKTLLLAFPLMVSVASALAQGTVNFANATSVYGSTVPDHLLRWGPDASFNYPPLTVGGLVSSNFANVNLSSLRVQLLYGASTVSIPTSLTAVTDAPASFRASSSANAGSWLGGTRTLLGFQPGDTVHLCIVAWETGFGITDPLQAVATGNNGDLYGNSGIFSYTIPAAGSPPTAYLPFNQLPFAVDGFIPEPGSFALLGLGGMTLLVLRRRNSKR